MQNDKGITIIALAVTIIVLIILAGVSINMVVGDNGIIKKAQEAKENMETAQIEEQKNLNELYWQIDNGLDLGGGSGQNACTNCILIYTKEQLIAFRDRVNGGDTCEGKTIKLMNDIDLNGSESDQWIPMTEFAGTFDGNYHTIKNMYMDTDQYRYLSMFVDLTETAQVKNLKIENCYMKNTYHELLYNQEVGWYSYGNSTSAICLNNMGDISNVWVTGNIIGYVPETTETLPESTRVRAHVSGIVSNTNYGSIRNCINEANIEGESMLVNDDCTVGAYASGICNGNVGLVSNCYNIGDLKANGYNTALVGGICATSGEATASQEVNCYNIGSISGTTVTYTPRNGGIVGKSVNNIDTIVNCYYLDTISTTVNYDGEKVQTESTMKSDVFIENLGYAYQKDESGINSGYPILKWQYNFYGNK